MVMLLALVLLVLLLAFVQCIVFAMLGILNIGQLAPVKVCVLLCNFSVREKKKRFWLCGAKLTQTRTVRVFYLVDRALSLRL